MWRRSLPFGLMLVLWAVPATTMAYVRCGDLTGDGRVDVADVVRMLRLVTGLETPDSSDLIAADIAPATIRDEWQGLDTVSPYGDSRLLINDVVLELRAAVSITTLAGCNSFPALYQSDPLTLCPGAGLHLNLVGHDLFEPGEMPRAWLGEIEVLPVRAYVNDFGLDVLEIVTPDLEATALLQPRVAGSHGLAFAPWVIRVVGDCAALAPRITSVQPAWGIQGSDTNVAIVGADLSCTRTLRVVGTTTGRVLQGRDIRPVGDHAIDAVLPAVQDQQDASFDLLLVTDCGSVTLPGAWSVHDATAPDAMILVPSANVPSDGGDLVVLRGAGLTAVSSIDFAGIPLAPGEMGFLVSSDFELVVRVPPNPDGKFVTTSGFITVRSAAHVDATPVPFTWAAVVLPTCTSLSPTTAYLRFDTSLRLAGTELQRVHQVRFGDVPATRLSLAADHRQLTVWPPTEIGPGTYQVELWHGGAVEAQCGQSFTWRP